MVKYTARWRVIMTLGLLIWLALAARLFYLQVLSHEDLALAAASQYEISVQGLDTRGIILDRNMQKLTGQSEHYYYILPVDRIDRETAALTESIKARKVSAGNGAYQVYRSEIFDWTVNSRLKNEYGAYAFACPSRYENNQTACHLIGYLNEDEKRGVSGLELLCEETLKAGNSKLALWGDSRGNILLGISPKQKSDSVLKDNSVVITLEKNLQRLCENALKENSINGSVIVSQAWDGEILAWVSSPAFNPNDIESYLPGGGDCLINKPVQGRYAPGSVFKVVTAAAALENNVCSPLKTFKCKGHITVEGVELGCNLGPEGGHGKVNMYEAMAMSCNCYFADLGEKTGGEAILEMAEKLGLGKAVLGFPGEESGNIMTPQEYSRQDISNLSIGQGKILVTPMQIQNMMNTIANGGIAVPMTIFPVNTEDGQKVQNTQNNNRILSAQTAKTLEEMLLKVMTEGTGSSRKWPAQVYGKSGTAEAVSAGRKISHCWFSGYCRIEGKRYTVTVMAEDGVSGSVTALPIFARIIDYISDK